MSKISKWLAENILWDLFTWVLKSIWGWIGGGVLLTGILLSIKQYMYRGSSDFGLLILLFLLSFMCFWAAAVRQRRVGNQQDHLILNTPNATQQESVSTLTTLMPRITQTGKDGIEFYEIVLPFTNRSTQKISHIVSQLAFSHNSQELTDIDFGALGPSGVPTRIDIRPGSTEVLSVCHIEKMTSTNRWIFYAIARNKEGGIYKDYRRPVASLDPLDFKVILIGDGYRQDFTFQIRRRDNQFEISSQDTSWQSVIFG